MGETRHMKLLVACDCNYAIGYKGDMLFKIPADQKRFKELTMNNIVIMGRKTLDSLPDGEPLPDRINIVLTGKDIKEKENLIIVGDEKDLLETLKKINPDEEKEVYCIGGGKTVAALMKYIDECFITMVNTSFRKADTWIPDLKADRRFKLVDESDPIPFENIAYQYQRYIKVVS